MYDRILVPTDGSTDAENALSHAVELAAAFDATIHGLYVVDLDRYGSVGSFDPLDKRLEGIGREALATVERVAADRGVETVTELREGSVHRQINDYAAEHDIDAIVMGSRGRSRLDRMLVGSVTERVVRTADRPVIVVRNRK
ncbi:universal stress protein [Halalkalicoccus paucihalophilus]|uniref:Universal stress protein n=1 Tax=Halalkalicoccus paucihalophilus TaxID=1008153 RepID=A0A151AHQ0_9EURY|nr:universal stress protein [Halalkalicoccus paucihalophilus]KYH27188.1 universal stress protein [Halalkalicoccus paucihalophilus]